MEPLHCEAQETTSDVGLSRTSDLLARGVRFTAAQAEALRALSEANYENDSCDAGHVRRVGYLAMQLGLLAGLDVQTARALQHAASLHDIGKCNVPLSILNKPGQLTPEERNLIEGHAEAGASLLAGDEAHLCLAAEIARHHHEWWNGYGYPCGLHQQQIPLSARIVAIADVFDALISVRPYKQAWKVADALAYLESRAGTQFDPHLTLIFTNFMQAQKAYWSEYEDRTQDNPVAPASLGEGAQVRELSPMSRIPA